MPVKLFRPVERTPPHSNWTGREHSLQRIAVPANEPPSSHVNFEDGWLCQPGCGCAFPFGTNTYWATTAWSGSPAPARKEQDQANAVAQIRSVLRAQQGKCLESRRY